MRYAPLFEVEFLHDYFLNQGSQVHEALQDDQRDALGRRYSARDFLDVFPSQRTLDVLAGHKMIFKATAFGFVVAVKLDSDASDDRPAIELGPDFQLGFALRIREPRFFNYTMIRSRPAFYRFGNDSANETAGGRFLSRPVPAFEPTRAYEAGEVHSAPDAPTIDLFRAVRDTGPSATPVAADWERIPIDTWDAATAYSQDAVVLFGNRLFRALVNGPGTDLNDASEWEPIGLLANQYVTAADTIVSRPTLFNLDLTSAALPQATIRFVQRGATTPSWEHTFVAESGDLGQVQLDVRALSPGMYSLEVLDAALSVVPGSGFDLYLEDEAVREGWFGIVEIGAGSGDLALLTGGGALRSPRYTLRFLNRATRWRYIFPAAQAVGTGADVAQEGADERILVTDVPRPLTRLSTHIRLQEDVAGPAGEVLLPDPETTRIRRQNDQWYSEIHVSNLPL